MNIEEALTRVSGLISSGKLDNVNEALISQTVIVPTLSALDWDACDPSEFIPQYTVGGGRVDYALCRADGNPLVFVEAKRLRGADISGEEQLFRYAYGQGAQLLILTDGGVWDFYLSMAEGIPAERRFGTVDLRDGGRILKHAQFFESHLRKDRVLSGEALDLAKKTLTDKKMINKAKRKIPGAWKTLLESANEALCNALMDAVEEDCQMRPDIDDVSEFLRQQVAAGGQTPEPTTTSGAARPGSLPPSAKKIVGYVLNGRPVDVNVGNRTLAEVLKEFHRRDSEFMPKFAARTARPRRRLVSRDREDLYSDRGLLGYSVKLDDGWWMGTNLNNVSIGNHIRTACEIAGVQFGVDLVLIER